MSVPSKEELEETREERTAVAQELAKLASTALNRSRTLLDGDYLPLPGEYEFASVAHDLLAHDTTALGEAFDASHVQRAIVYIGSGGTR